MTGIRVDRTGPFCCAGIKLPERHPVHRPLVERPVIELIPVFERRLCRVRVKRFTRRLFDTDVPDLDARCTQSDVEFETGR